MSYYRREPRCGNCYGRGHTKPQCPNLSDFMKSHYKQIAKNRACTHCSRNGYENAIGHNKRGCIKYREDREVYKRDVITFRKLCVQYYEKHNIGVGTVISIPVSNWRRYGKLAEVENDILFVKEFIIPVRLSRPTFRLHSTVTGDESYSGIIGAGMNSVIEFESSLPRIGNREISMGVWREKDGMLVLTGAVEGATMLEDMAQLDREDNIEYPDIME